MAKKDLIDLADLSKDEVLEIFSASAELKKKLKEKKQADILKGKTLVMLFEKPSLRTRVTFEVGMFQLGGIAINLDPSTVKLGVRESIYDAAKNFSRWVNGIMVRTFSHKKVEELAEYSEVPVINGLTDLLHPCQILTDVFTIIEKFSLDPSNPDLKGIKVSYVGDGNNVVNSLVQASGLLGFDLSIASPEGYFCSKKILDAAGVLAKTSGARIEVGTNPYEAVKDADVVYTDVWVSMGKESEQSKRLKIFKPFQVNKKLFARAKKTAFFMHCLPAHRGEEVTDEVIDNPNSIVFDQAENRLHVQKGILSILMKNS
ncbi:MAG: ornithine carbamoyltransferase [Candidatus Aureabacteria bacterium]|nr:ornithine carbamoyltransferase [Candidatus Auribacterota bacterium]